LPAQEISLEAAGNSSVGAGNAPRADWIHGINLLAQLYQFAEKSELD
jgi:hypothetical protein